MFYSPKRKYIPENNPIEEQDINQTKEIEKEKKEKEKNEEEDIENYLNEVEEYELEFDDEKYNLKTGYSKEKDSIYLKIKPIDKNIENKNITIFYEGLFSSNDLTKLCKSFRMYDSIEEIFSAFCVIFENKKAYIKQNNEDEKEEKSLNLVIVVGSATGKEDEICLCLTKKEIHNIVEEKKEEEKNMNTNNIVINNECNCQFKEKEKEINLKIERIEKDLRAENYELKNEIYYLKDDINRYKKTIDSNKKEIKTLKTQIKDLKSSFEEKIKNLTDKINSINIINSNNNNNENSNNKIIKDSNILDNNNINKEVTENKNSKNNNKNNEVPAKTNVSSIAQKKDLSHSSKNINNNNPKKINKPVVNTTSKNTKNQNTDKKINNKREIYQQMKAANAQKLNNTNKEKTTSFGEFLKQRKNAASNKNNQSIEVKEPSKDNKNKNKVLQKNKTDFLPEKSNTKASQSVIIEKNNILEKENIENENNEENEKEVEYEIDDDYKEEDEEDNLNINENININNENGNNNENNENNDNDGEGDNGYDIQRIKTYDVNRSDKIDQFKFDFDLNVKKLLQDNESKLKLAEKLNTMNRRIINNVEELQLIENQLYKNYPDTKDIEFRLLYRASEDGDSSKAFHEKCDNTPFTLTLVRNMDGTKFGGYTEESWEGKNKNKKDYHSFCFSLTKNKIYNIHPEKTAIICDPSIAPSFGGPLFKIFDNFFNKGGKCYSKDKCSYSGQDNDFEITNGVENFEIHEIEVYQLTLN